MPLEVLHFLVLSLMITSILIVIATSTLLIAKRKVSSRSKPRLAAVMLLFLILAAISTGIYLSL
ncbi:MAG: hypothetical protein M1477_04105 [Candidatus Thermoplasmatota archaeon]|nr:hypothetical protein [Candidatus Thermoplasmatota archaeon]